MGNLDTSCQVQLDDIGVALCLVQKCLTWVQMPL